MSSKNESPETHTPQGPTIVAIADGWTRSVFLEMLDSGELPEIDDLLVKDGHLIEDVVCNLPSVSMASHTSILTSSFQDQHGIPAHRWRDSTSGEIRNYLTANGPARVNLDFSRCFG